MKLARRIVLRLLEPELVQLEGLNGTVTYFIMKIEKLIDRATTDNVDNRLSMLESKISGLEKK